MSLDSQLTSALPSVDTRTPIDRPTACAPFELGDGITILPSYLPVPGMGVLPANAFLLDGPEPTLVDTGPGGAQAGFQAALRSVADVEELRWVWLTHTDPDHTGSLQWLLDAAPRARVVTTFLAAGKLGMQMVVHMDRLLWVNPGTEVELNGRRLLALRPPTFDAPETTAVFDRGSRTLYSADSFGALLAEPTGDAGEIDRHELADSMRLWSTVDSPWAAHTDLDHYRRQLHDLAVLAADRILSSHLPPAVAMTGRLLENLAAIPGAPTWVGPDQQALDAMLAAMAG